MKIKILKLSEHLKTTLLKIKKAPVLPELWDIFLHVNVAFR